MSRSLPVAPPWSLRATLQWQHEHWPLSFHWVSSRRRAWRSQASWAVLLGGRRGPLFSAPGSVSAHNSKLAQLSPLNYALIRTWITLWGGRDRPIPAANGPGLFLGAKFVLSEIPSELHCHPNHHRGFHNFLTWSARWFCSTEPFERSSSETVWKSAGTLRPWRGGWAVPRGNKTLAEASRRQERKHIFNRGKHLVPIFALLSIPE